MRWRRGAGTLIRGPLICLAIGAVSIPVASIEASTASPQATVAVEEPLRVLFIGNSLTFYNDLPQVVEKLSRTTGGARPVEAAMIARGGETFSGHTERRDDEAPLKVIARGEWDFVVLQENGRLIARSTYDSFPFASRLVRAVREVDATPIFYMTWAYRDHPETHATIRTAYARLSSRLKIPVAPVGEAWRLARSTAPDLELFNPDGIHPSPQGSYLAAWVILSTIYRLADETPLGAPEGAEAGIAPEAANRLQSLARQALKADRLEDRFFTPG